MQPDSPLPPYTSPHTEPSILEELQALTSLLNPEVIWHEEELLDNLDEQATQQAPAAPSSDAA